MNEMGEDLKVAGKRIREIRNELRLSQKEMAAALGIAGPKLSKIESGVHAPGYSFLYKLATVLNVSLDYLVTGEGDMLLKSKSRSPDSTDSILDSLENLEELNWFLEHSPVLRNTVIGFAAKYRYDNLSMINIDIQHKLSKA
ncbi:MAG: helix-turn-helix transcriptional regulator [bacterium]|nr:helix-turn-helix transcriptional regulator [bacterium]